MLVVSVLSCATITVLVACVLLLAFLMVNGGVDVLLNTPIFCAKALFRGGGEDDDDDAGGDGDIAAVAVVVSSFKAGMVSITSAEDVDWVVVALEVFGEASGVAGLGRSGTESFPVRSGHCRVVGVVAFVL